MATRVADSTNILCNRALFCSKQLFTYSGADPVLTTKALVNQRGSVKAPFVILNKNYIFANV